MATDQYVPVCDLAELESEGRTVVQENGQAIALFFHEAEVYAVDNRCPHMGFPLVRGTVDEGILTCHWHHARFELEEGDTFDPWADDAQTFPVDVRNEQIFIDPDPEPTVPPATRWRNRLADGMQENISLVQAKAVLGLDEHGDGFDTPLETAVNFGTKYRSDGGVAASRRCRTWRSCTPRSAVATSAGRCSPGFAKSLITPPARPHGSSSTPSTTATSRRSG